MEAYAKTKHLRLSTNKARLVARLIKGKNVEEAFAILKVLPQKAARFFEKVLKSAVANAENNFEMDKDTLYVHRAYVDAEGPLKRLYIRGMGRADIQRKPMNQIIVIVKDKEEA
ncbi:MAG: 50S ribosomal protein L22 [Nitrospiraceae bacterium]|nr:50S ribosomal protein L22 [Nitrospiraceae bacterium]